jgi:assimilatory nitrate reductase catalytic subunit
MIAEPINTVEQQAEVTASTCPYCGVGCGVLIQTKLDTQGIRFISGVQGDPKHPANFGKLCSKGANLHLGATPTVQQQARLAHPAMRTNKLDPLVQCSWDDALQYATEQFASIIKSHGPDAVAFYVSGQLLTEDYYVFNKLAKGLIGTNNIDTNSRLCMSSAVAGYKASLGADAPPCSYEDIDHAQVVFISGSNTAYAHPVLYRRLEQARANKHNTATPLRTIVVDPRLTDTAQEADLFLPILPGTDVALYNAMLHQMLWEGWIDRSFIEQHTQGFEALRTAVRECTPAWAARICGVPEADIVKAAHWFSEGPTLSLYCQGLNQSSQGTDKNTALINLHLVTAQIGKAGAGPFSLTGQPNAMGGREVGGLANLISAHREMSNPEHRQQVAQLWNVPDVPATPGKTAVELFEAVGNGTIKAVWIVCTNPANSMPDAQKVAAALAGSAFVVVQDAYSDTASAAFANLVLPASTWGEKDGTVTNSERRISRVRSAVDQFAQARNDWMIARDFAQLLKNKLNPSSTISFDYPNVESVWNEHRESTRGRDLDITGLSYNHLEQHGPQQWPMPEGKQKGTARLYTTGQFATTSKKANLLYSEFKPPVDKTSARFPLQLNTGRLRDQWHTMSRTGLVGKLFSHEAEPWLDMNSLDMGRRRFNDGDFVSIESARGSMSIRVRNSTSVRSGQCFVAMHWGPEVLISGGINNLTQPAFDARSKQPELKSAAVRVEKIELPFRLTMFASLSASRAITARKAIAQLLKGTEHEYALAIPLSLDAQVQDERSKESPTATEGLLIRLASSNRISASLASAIEKTLNLASHKLLRYSDPKAGQQRTLEIRDGRLTYGMIQGDTRSERWLMQLLQQRSAVPKQNQFLLVSRDTPPDGLKQRERIVCNCFGVSQDKIKEIIQQTVGGVNQQTVGGVTQPAINANSCLSALQTKTGCGTNCGSCLPELKSLIRNALSQEASYAS